MKPFFIILVFIMLLSLFASEAMNTTDLTPGTPYDPGPGAASADGGGANFTMNLNAPAAGGPCAGRYTVRQGDTLSQIARTCGVTLDLLLSANPSITNPNLIQPGQELSIFYFATPAPTTSLPDPGMNVPLPVLPTATSEAAVLPTATSEAAPLPTAAPAQQAIPNTVLRPGETVTVSITDFPPLSLVKVEMGKEGGPLEYVKGPQIGTDGSLRVEVAVPPNALPGEVWVVVVTSTANPDLIVRSPLFTIAP